MAGMSVLSCDFFMALLDVLYSGTLQILYYIVLYTVYGLRLL